MKFLSILLFTAVLGVMAVSSALAQDATTTSLIATTTPPVINLACMQTAVEKRDNAIISAMNVFSAAIVSALTVRRDALKTTWSISDGKERRKARATAWKEWINSHRTIRKDFLKNRKEAWKTFDQDAKACGASRHGEIQGQDISL